jgi:hypothetical protein
MPIGTPVTLGHTGALAGGSGAWTVSTSATVSSGGTLLVAVGWYGPSVTVTVSGGGLTWTLDKQYNSASDSGIRIALYSAPAPSGLASATTITATPSGSVNNKLMAVAYTTGLATSSVVDGTPSGGQGVTAAWSSGSISTTVAADLILSASWHDGVSTNTASGGTTELDDFQNTNEAVSMTTGYQITSSTGSYTGTGTWGAAGTYVAVAVAYKSPGGGTDATVTAVVATSTGAGAVAAVSAGSTVSGAPATGLGDSPTAAVTVSANSTVTATVATGLGSAPVPAISSGFTVTAVVADATGVAAVPTVTAGSTVTGTVADATGDTPAAVVSAGMPLLDDFERADESPLGSPWLESGYTDVPPFTLVGGAIYGAGGAIAQRYDEVYDPDVTVRAVLRSGEELDTADGRGGTNINVAVRGSGTLYPDNTKCYFGDVVYDGVSITGYIGIYDYTLGGGGFAILDDTLLITSPAWVGGIEFQASGSTLTLRVMTSPDVWEDFVTATDTQLPNAGGVGLGRTGGTGDSDDWYGIEAVYLLGTVATGIGATVTGTPADATGAAVTASVTASAGTAAFSTYPNGLLAAPWQAWTASLPTVTGGKAFDTSGFGDATYAVVTDTADSMTEAIFEAALTATTGQNFGVATRLTAHSGSANGYSFEISDGLGGTTFIPVLYKGSGFTTIATGTAIAGASSIDGIRITTVGSTISGYCRISGVWTLAVTVTDSTYTAAGYPGFWVQDPTVGADLGVTQVTWGAAGAVGATVTAVAATATGQAPAATVAAAVNATVSAAPAVGTGANPPAAVSAGATTVAVAALALGSAPVPALRSPML